VAETTVKRLLCCRFQHTGKVMGQAYQCWQRICQEINVFSRFEYHTFYVLYPFVTYLLTLPHNSHEYRDIILWKEFVSSLLKSHEGQETNSYGCEIENLILLYDGRLQKTPVWYSDILSFIL
jgi:hypothetical protein